MLSCYTSLRLNSFQGWKASLAQIKVEVLLGLGIVSDHKVALQELILYDLIHFLS